MTKTIKTTKTWPVLFTRSINLYTKHHVHQTAATKRQILCVFVITFVFQFSLVTRYQLSWLGLTHLRKGFPFFFIVSTSSILDRRLVKTSIYYALCSVLRFLQNLYEYNDHLSGRAEPRVSGRRSERIEPRRADPPIKSIGNSFIT